MTLRGATVLTHHGPRDWDLWLDDGRISGLEPWGADGHDADDVDLRGKWILPGCIDPHVHFREPGAHEHKATYASESRAAAAGGVTTVFTMPNTVPPTRDPETYKAVRRRARASVVNYAFHLYADAENVQWLAINDDVPSYKLYLNETTGVSTPLADERVLRRILAVGHPLTAHAEGDTLDWLLDLHRRHGRRLLYICHLSTAAEVKAVRAAKARGQWVYGEVTPHHLFLTDRDAERLGAYADMRPTLKTQADQDALWEGISDGTIDCIGTDHAPHLRSEKESDSPPPGVPGLQTMLPLLLTAVRQGRLDASRLVRLTSRNAALIFGVPRRQEIKLRAAADLVIVDPEAQSTITDAEQLTHPGWTPFAGWACTGAVVATLLAGRVIYRHGQERVPLEPGPGGGQLIACRFPSEPPDLTR